MAPTISWPRRAIRHDSSMPSSRRPDSWLQAVPQRPGGTDADDAVEALLGLLGLHGVATATARSACSPATRADGASCGTAASTRPPHASAPTPAAATSGRPTTMPAAAPAPASTMPSGDIIARATSGVKKRSRNDGTSASEVADHGGEDLVDRRRVAGVVRRRPGRLGDRPQRQLVGVVAVGDREQPHRLRARALAARLQRRDRGRRTAGRRRRRCRRRSRRRSAARWR